jgi:hypothetical protein
MKSTFRRFLGRTLPNLTRTMVVLQRYDSAMTVAVPGERTTGARSVGDSHFCHPCARVQRI